MKAEAIALAQGDEDIQTVDLDVNNKESLSRLIQGTDIVAR
jgi:hypothetical protein